MLWKDFEWFKHIFFGFSFNGCWHFQCLCRLCFKDLERSGMCATFKWCPYTFPPGGAPEFSVILFQLLNTNTHQKQKPADWTRALAAKGGGRGLLFVRPVSETGGALAAADSICRSMHKKRQQKNKNTLRKARGTKQCSAYSHPCTVPPHRCRDASAGPNAAALSASGHWPCMEIFHLFNLRLCQTPSVLPV